MKHFKLFLFAILPVLALTFITSCGNDDEDGGTGVAITVTGTVTDAASGDALEGVSVNSGRATASTDAEGNYSIEANEDGLLVFELNGYMGENVNVDKRNVIDVQLIQDTPGDNSTIYSETKVAKECEDDTEIEVTQVRVTDRGEGTGTTTWTKDKVWVLDGFVFVNEGQTLTIEAGTIVKGSAGQGELASALIVAQGGKLMAEGTASAPIIMTSAADGIVNDANGNPCAESGYGPSVRGLWGGLIILGKADLNAATETRNIEGIPSDEVRGIYGGSDDSDNSGTIKYVSVRHGGSDIGAGNEINGVTMGGVGNGTTIDYVEVFANRDDGFEWFGGTVNTKHLISAFCGDDAMDYDEGWRGLNQFWLVWQDDAGDRGGEHDGGPSDCETCQPFATPVVYNASYRGRGVDADKRLITFRDNAGGEYHNSIFWSYGRGIDIEDLAGDEDSYNHYLNGALLLENNIFFDMGTDDVIQTSEGEVLTIGTNIIATDVPVNSDLSAANDATSAGSTPSNSFFDNAAYKGAFAPTGTPWYANWSRLSREL